MSDTDGGDETRTNATLYRLTGISELQDGLRPFLSLSRTKALLGP